VRQVDIPELHFSPWYRWENRNQYQLRNYPGVYLIAISNQELEGDEPLYADVVYIGMTNRQEGLRARWNEFQSAIKGGEGHGPGKRIFGEKGHYQEWSETLYVSGMGIKRDDSPSTREYYIKRGWVAFLEQEAFAEFCTEVGGHPKYNKQ